jgi:hypothetical protein
MNDEQILIDSHWAYVKSICEKMYCDAFKHGLRHGAEKAEKTGVLCERKDCVHIAHLLDGRCKCTQDTIALITGQVIGRSQDGKEQVSQYCVNYAKNQQTNSFPVDTPDFKCTCKFYSFKNIAYCTLFSSCTSCLKCSTCVSFVHSTSKTKCEHHRFALPPDFDPTQDTILCALKGVKHYVGECDACDIPANREGV